MNRINQGKLNGEQAAELLGLSERHVRRLLARFREDEASALAHGNRGRPSTQRIEEEERNRIVLLAQSEYAGINQQHFTELLAEQEQLSVSRSTVRRVLTEAGIRSPRHHRRRRRKHRTRRERYPQEGMLLQIDGSPHDWLERRGPRMTLLAGIDDATGKILGALFREQEDAQGYFMLLQQITQRYGRPLAIYRDRHSIFEGSKKEPTLEEQLRGSSSSTQFGRLLEDLDIRSIRAFSPQAKGGWNVSSAPSRIDWSANLGSTRYPRRRARSRPSNSFFPTSMNGLRWRPKHPVVRIANSHARSNPTLCSPLNSIVSWLPITPSASAPIASNSDQTAGAATMPALASRSTSAWMVTSRSTTTIAVSPHGPLPQTPHSYACNNFVRRRCLKILHPNWRLQKRNNRRLSNHRDSIVLSATAIPGNGTIAI